MLKAKAFSIFLLTEDRRSRAAPRGGAGAAAPEPAEDLPGRAGQAILNCFNRGSVVYST